MYMKKSTFVDIIVRRKDSLCVLVRAERVRQGGVGGGHPQAMVAVVFAGPELLTSASLLISGCG